MKSKALDRTASAMRCEKATLAENLHSLTLSSPHVSPVMVTVAGSPTLAAADTLTILEQIEGALAYLDTVGTRAEDAALSIPQPPSSPEIGRPFARGRRAWRVGGKARQLPLA